MKKLTRKPETIVNCINSNEGEIMRNTTVLSSKEFNETVVSAMKEYYGEDYDIMVNQVVKNNDNVLDGLVIRSEGQQMVPTIYLNKFYEEYQSGRTMESISMEVRAINEGNQSPEIPFEPSSFTDFYKMKDRILFKLVNRNKNRSLLESTPHVKFQDLAVIFYIVISINDSGVSSVTIRNNHMDIWGVTIDDLYNLAMLNTPRILPGTIMSMQNVLYDIMKEEVDNGIGDNTLPDELMEMLMNDMSVQGRNENMYVLTNSSKMNGSISILYNNLLRDFANSICKDLFILPSSIHEVLLVPASYDMNADSLKEMVLDVNRTQVAPDEILSDNVYYYDRMTVAISQC